MRKNYNIIKIIGFIKIIIWINISFKVKNIFNRIWNFIFEKKFTIKINMIITEWIVEDNIIIELKAVADLRKEHELQLLNYLAAIKKEVGLLINFGHSVQVKRKIMTPVKIKPCNPWNPCPKLN